MRPVKLVISAFGPYSKEEVIDFSLLNGKNIFLITGPTGAGKTTIFDAISYALFGEASGSTRENDSLRSDFSDDKRLTFVELDFELRGQIYHIKRIPQQLKPKVKGEGFTTQSAEAELIMPDGKVRTGANNVSHKINELLGINKDQFKQIVMLPQGEFKKLLLADSKEREVIFRKIFGTQTFEKIQSILNDRAKAISKDLEKSRDKILINIKNIKSEEPIINGDLYEFSTVVDKIKVLLKDDKAKASEIDKKLKDIKAEIEKNQKLKFHGENNNKLLHEKNSIEEKLKNLTAKKEEIRQKEDIVNKANKAKEIFYIEEQVIRQKANKEKKLIDRKNILLKIEEIKEKLKTAEEDLKNQEIREEEKNKLIESINLLKDKKPKVIEYSKKLEEIKVLEKLAKDNELKISKEEENIKTLREELKLKEDRIKEILELEKEKLKLDKEVEEKNNLIKEVRDLYKGLKEYEELYNKYNALKANFEGIEVEYKKSKNDYEEKEEVYMKEQAGILAAELKDNIPCPVCGSLEHPNPAKRISSVPTESELKNSKKIFEQNQILYNNSLLELSSIKKKNETLLNDVINRSLEKLSNSIECGISYDNDTIQKVLLEGKKLGNLLNLLKEKDEKITNKITEKDKIGARINIINNELNFKENALIELRNKYTETFAKFKSEEETINILEKEVPKEIRSLEVLENKIKNLESRVEEIIKSMKESLQKVNDLKNLLCGENSKFNETNKLLNEIKDTIEDISVRMDEKIKEYGFEDYEEYDSKKRYIDKIDEITKEINLYKEELKSIKDRSEDIKEKTKNLTYVDLSEYEKNIEELRKTENSTDDEAKEIYSTINNNAVILKEIESIQQGVNEKEQKYKVVGELANLSNGQKSPYITFERFVLASYFQQIIDSANIRLAKMTGERYILKRKEDKGKGRSQQGLELEVYDNYTGKCRHVKTLSGGESFKASLALALGLSDVVQSNAGGISLDTIFIDEGFGTLDSESLENSISTLIELQKGGRLVGIISHVPELKERIDAKLEIKAAAEGSSVQFIIN